MKAIDLILAEVRKEMQNEEAVRSSWISSINYDETSGDIIMVLKNGKSYNVPDIGEDLFKAWLRSPSKGMFWHNTIKDMI